MTKVKTAFSYVILILASFLSAFPLYYMICGATNTSIDIVRGRLLPGTHLLENFQTLIATQNLGRAMFNSFRNAIVITVVALLVCSIAGYGFEIYHDKGKDILMSILLLAMMLPFVAIMIPLFKMFSAWKLVNTWIALALPSISTPFLIMMFRQAARSFHMISSRPPDWKDSVRSRSFHDVSSDHEVYLRSGNDGNIHECVE